MSKVSQARVENADARNPWPGLSSFDESAQQFFNGRRRETAELSRLVLSGHLTVLFGASGLGKTSLLQAGLFPVLRRSHILPVYLRLAVTDRRVPLIEQVRSTFENELRLREVDAPAFHTNESLWEYLHRDDLELWSKQNHLLTPLLVFDQFEETLTLGADNPQGIEQLRMDLADLIENRIPAALAGRSLDALALDRRRYKVLLSFREDYLAGFERWKQELPSIMRNRFALSRMNSIQAMEAVAQTGVGIISETVAKSVVLFVAAAKDDQAQADELPDSLEVEPALLSVVCHELNAHRLRDGRASITAGDVEASRGNILNDFYERSFSGLPSAARIFIEDRLLTASGFRNTSPEEEAAAAGIPADVITQLIERRLIRREFRLGISHVELTHDLLTGVVRESRDRRVEQARRATEEIQRSQEEGRRRSKAIRIVSVFAGTLVLLFAVIAMISANRARRESDRAAAALRAAQEHELKAKEAAATATAALKTAEEVTRQLEEEAAVSKVALATARIRAGSKIGFSQVIAGSSGRRIVTIGLDGAARVVNESGSVLGTLTDISPIRTAAINASETLVATVSSSGNVSVWTVSPLDNRSSFESPRPPSSVAFSGNSGRLLLAYSDGSMELVEEHTGKVVRTIAAAARATGCVPFSAAILDYNPVPGLNVTALLEAECVGGDSFGPPAEATQHVFTPAQAALALGPASKARPLDPAEAQPEKEKQAELPAAPPSSPSPTVAKAVRPVATEEWRMAFRIGPHNGEPYVSLEVNTSAGDSVSSRKIVQDGLDERQLRAVALELDALIRKLPKSITSPDPKTKVTAAEIAPAHSLSVQTAKAILKILGLRAF